MGSVKVCPSCRLRYEDAARYCLVDGAALEELTDPRIGHVLAGRYLIEEVIGRGGMATVYRAQHTLGRGQVAVKVLHECFADDLRFHERFSREAQRAKALAHPNILEIYDFGQTEDGIPYLTMELLAGHPLDQVLRRRGALDPTEVIALGLQIARGLSRAHDLGVVHRDVKPENIFLCRSDDGAPVVKLVDFGIAVQPDDRRLTVNGQMIGSPRYMAPERFRDKQLILPASDLYALGIVLFEMLTGRFPFESETVAGYLLHHMETPPPRVRSLVSACPPALDDLVDELLAKDPLHRPVDAHAVVSALEGMAPESARRVRQVSALSPKLRASGVALRLEAWAQRAATYAQMLERSWPEGSAPDALVERVAELHASIARLRALHTSAKATEEALAGLEARVKADRERLGYAIQALAEDLSKVKARARGDTLSTVPGGMANWADAYRASLAKLLDLDRRHPTSPSTEALGALEEARRAYEQWLAQQQISGARDLEFQIDALRERLAALDEEARAERDRMAKALEANGEERALLEARLVEHSQELDAALSVRPELSDLFARLRSGRAS